MIQVVTQLATENQGCHHFHINCMGVVLVKYMCLVKVRKTDVRLHMLPANGMNAIAYAAEFWTRRDATWLTLKLIGSQLPDTDVQMALIFTESGGSLHNWLGSS